MMRGFLAALLLALLATPVAIPVLADDGADNPVLIITRHAEKTTGDDPCLTDEGRERAARLAALLENQPIAALLSTDYCRTRETLAVLSSERGIELRIHAATDAGALRDALGKAGNRAVVVAGHSNTIPALLAKLGVNTGPIAEDEYDNLFILTFNKEDITPGSLVRLSY